jgi:hypothetical protein
MPPQEELEIALNRREAIELIVLGSLNGETTKLVAAGAPTPAEHPDAQNSVSLETRFWVFRLWRATGKYELLDKQTGVAWRSNPFNQRFGEVALRLNGQVRHADLSSCDVRRRNRGLEIIFQPVQGQREMGTQDQSSLRLTVTVDPVRGGKGLELSYTASDPSQVENVLLLDDAFWTTDAEKGSVAVPVRMGLLIPAAGRRKFSQNFDTYAYEGCHMEWLGVVKNGATAMMTWEDSYVDARVKSELPETGEFAGRQILLPSIQLRKSARSLQVTFVGKGDYMTIAKAYRRIVVERGLHVSWSRKIRTNPERKKLLGAIDFRLGRTLDRQMNADSTKQEYIDVNWTFEEAAQVAEHLKNDLKLDRVLFILGGWIHRGYDNEHPDIMPPAPECGGAAGLADCSRRVQQLGYVFGLHDHYQDIYRDSPSWSESLIMKHSDGTLMKGGRWAGG